MLGDVHTQKFSKLVLCKYEWSHSRCRKYIQCWCNLAQSLTFYFFTSRLCKYHLNIIKLEFHSVTLHTAMLANFCIVKDQFAQVAICQTRKLVSLQSIDFSPFTKQNFCRHAIKVNKLKIVIFNELCITWAFIYSRCTRRLVWILIWTLFIWQWNLMFRKQSQLAEIWLFTVLHHFL